MKSFEFSPQCQLAHRIGAVLNEHFPGWNSKPKEKREIHVLTGSPSDSALVRVDDQKLTAQVRKALSLEFQVENYPEEDGLKITLK